MKENKSEEYYSDLLRSELAFLPQKVETLFDIAGFPHYENVMSNFYAYYFNPIAEHEFGDLFINAITNIISRKRNGLSIISKTQTCYAEREVCTHNGKFIDIVIKEPSESINQVENAIIIENKVNATIYNELSEYYNYIDVNNSKIGVVLSTKKESNLPDYYINILHIELVEEVEQSAASYFLNANLKHTIILKEFIQNIKHMNQKINLKEHYEFFFKNQKKIKEISELYQTVKEDIYRQVDDVCLMLGLELTLEGKYNSQLRYFTSKHKHVYFTILLNNLFNGDGKISIIVEIGEKGLQHIDEINKIPFNQEERKLLFEKAKIRKTYLHFAKTMLAPTQENLKDFTNYIYNQITTTPLKDIFIKVEETLSKYN